MRAAPLIATALSLSLLASCGSNPEPDATEEGTLSDPADIIAPTDFASLTLGGTIQGPLGPEVETSLVAGDTAIGDIASRVQCPESVDPCDPENAAGGTIYTYIYEIRPGFDGPNDEGFAMPAEVMPVESAESFSLTFPAYGFTGVAGYNVAKATERLAAGFNPVISCEDGKLMWTFPPESGWSTGETITFFWQSTQPPTGPTGRYRFVGDGREAIGMGPMPREGGELPAVCD